MRITIADLIKAARGDVTLPVDVIEPMDAMATLPPGECRPTAGYYRAKTGDNSYCVMISVRPEDEGVTMTDFDRQRLEKFANV